MLASGESMIALIVAYKFYINLAVAAFAAGSAACWLTSALVKVKHRNGVGADATWRDSSISSDGADVLKTMKKQSKWNTYAAWLAALAATSQAFAALAP